jgi:hypothetical protein
MSEEETWKVVLFLNNMQLLPSAVKSEWEAGKHE